MKSWPQVAPRPFLILRLLLSYTGFPGMTNPMYRTCMSPSEQMLLCVNQRCKRDVSQVVFYVSESNT
jgi:hypothetical protein